MGLADRDHNKVILNYKEVRLNRILLGFAAVITPAFSFLWAHFNSHVSEIRLISLLLSGYNFLILFMSFKNEYFKQRLNNFLYGSYYLVSMYAIYLGYRNNFLYQFTIILMMVIFYIILTFNKLSDLFYYLMSTIILLIGTLYVSHLKTNSSNEIIIGASFVVFSIIAVFNLHIRMGFQSALRESHEDYQRLLDSMPEGIIVHENLKIVYANPVIMKMLDKDS